MAVLDSIDLTERENFKILTGSILPRPIAWITTLQENGKVNMAPFSYFNIVTANPPLISVSVRYDTDSQKDTSRNIFRNKEFVVHIISHEYLKQANDTSISLGRDESEVEFAGLTLADSINMKTPGVKEAKVRFECVYETHINFEHTDLIIGRVKTYHINEDVYNDGKIDLDELNPVSRLSGARYGLIGEKIFMEKPVKRDDLESVPSTSK